jgi:hypothetical protein
MPTRIARGTGGLVSMIEKVTRIAQWGLRTTRATRKAIALILRVRCRRHGLDPLIVGRRRQPGKLVAVPDPRDPAAERRAFDASTVRTSRHGPATYSILAFLGHAQTLLLTSSENRYHPPQFNRGIPAHTTNPGRVGMKIQRDFLLLVTLIVAAQEPFRRAWPAPLGNSHRRPRLRTGSNTAASATVASPRFHPQKSGLSARGALVSLLS